MAKKKSMTQTKKLELIKACVKGDVTRQDAARKVGVHVSSIKRWISLYESEGEAGFIKEDLRHYSAATKRMAVEEYLAGGKGLFPICEKYKIRSTTQLRRWILLYNEGKELCCTRHSGGSRMKKARETTQEERIEIVKECLNSGKDYGKMALKHLVSYQQVRTWTLRYEALGEAGLEDRRGKRKKNQEPRTELERLQIENEKLKHQLYLAEMETNLLKKLQELERGTTYHK